tara:strand:+ start:151 stop:1128 length:978 start_codon:yes stop_codon:yes gene_type:complete
MNIGVAWGGYTSEKIISKMSGELVYNVLKIKHKVLYSIEFTENEWIVNDGNGFKSSINKKDFSFFKNNIKITFDLIINMIHGAPGENGELASYLEKLKIAHTSCDSFSAELTYNKKKCLKAAKSIDIPIAQNLKISLKEPYDLEKKFSEIGFPCFVKPNNSGSSFGVFKVNSFKDLKTAIIKSLQEDDEVLIESYIEGREFSVGIMNWNDLIKVLPITEIISENDFFDYEAKYKGKSKEITPAIISDDWKRSLQNMTIKLYKYLNLTGICRAEFIIKDNIPYFLEINTVPGMTEKSIIPQQLNSAGITLNEFFENLISVSIRKNK